jgi:methionyl-tRNA formyltransferase
VSLIRIVFLGTPEFARHHLAGLLSDDHFKVVGVVTQPDRPSGRNMKPTPSAVKELALAHNLPLLQPEKMNEPETLEAIKAWKAEAAVVVAYGQILPQKFLDMFPAKVVNIHGSLLPRWRGAAPIQRAIMAGDKETGVSLQVMVKKLDAGDVIGEEKISITENMTAIELHELLWPLGVRLLHVEFMDYLRGNLMPKPQNENAITYAHKIDKAEAKIDWSLSAQEIYNRMRGLVLGPGSFAEFKNKKIKIHEALPQLKLSGKPGQVIAVDEKSLTVACGQGALQIFVVQPESKPKMKVHDFLLGHPVKLGEQWQ